MNRKSHKKSRGGCVGCKGRHRKCDETRPQCVNCTTAKMECSFLTDVVSGRSPVTRDGTNASGSASPSGMRSFEYAYLPSSTPTTHRQVDDVTLNLDQIELIHHFTTATAETLSEDPAQQMLWRTTSVRHGLASPFLMYGILAISALHLSCCDAQRKPHFQNRAVELHGLALGGYKAAVANLGTDNCIPVVLFAGLITLHTVVDSTGALYHSLNTYLEHMLSYVRLSQGNRFIVKQWWDFLLQSECRPLLNIALRLETDIGPLPAGWHVLSTLITGAKTDMAVYAEALKQLQRVYNSTTAGEDKVRFSTIFAWLVLVPDDYHRKLEQRRPEALILLAYYGVLLHGHRHHWAIGGRGAFLVHAIHAHLGSYWEKGLVWPLDMVRQN